MNGKAQDELYPFSMAYGKDRLQGAAIYSSWRYAVALERLPITKRGRKIVVYVDGDGGGGQI